LEELENRLTPSVNVLTYHNDVASTGVNSNETLLTPANVTVGSFGKLFTTGVDGQIYAQPLTYAGITIGSGPNTSNGVANTVHDVVFVSTEHDSLYAIDAGASGGAVLWKRSFTDITTPGYTGSTPGTNINNPSGATAITTVSSSDVNSTDISPEIGITGTPVIDPVTNTLYVVTKTKETIGGSTHFVQRLHAINFADGTDRATPFLIGDTTNGNTNSTNIYVYGTGDGAVTDPYNGTGQQVVQFNALREHQRGALSLVNNQVYVEWASHGDNGPYHGWVVAWDVSHLGTSGFVLNGVFNTTPNGGLGGIWQGGGRLAFEADGSAFYFETGNGPGGHGNPVLNANGFPVDGDYYEALIKVVADPTTTATSQNINGWGFKAVDYFIPYNQVALDNADRDFGSGGPLILPDSAGIPGHQHLLVASGKEGKIYLIDRDTGKMGEFDPNNDNVLNSIPNGSGNNTPPVQLGASLSTASYYNGKIYWTSGYSSTANAYVINSNGTLSITSQTAATFGYLPGSVDISSNGASNGIAWVMDRNANEIHAYDASTFSTELWNSGQKSGGADNLGAVVKFAVPTIANGEVYVGTTNSLVVYGLTPPANTIPNAPVLTATALSGSSVNLTWTDSTPAPNTATLYKIELSTDDVTFTQVTTAPAGATALAIGGLTPLTKYYFRIRGTNGIGDSPYSNEANATTTDLPASLDFSSGFAGSNSQLTYNGSAKINTGKMELTDNGQNEAGSAFSTNLLDVTKFTNQFTFQLNGGANTADGFTFTIQGVAPTALGASGGGLGYGTDGVNPGNIITQSVAIKFDLYNNQGEGPDSTGLYTNGSSPTNIGSIDLTPSGINLHSGDKFQVNMTYDGTTLTVTIKDTLTNKSATEKYTIDIPTTVGASMAYVGFTGGTGGVTATQDILTWIYVPGALQAPNAPSGLGGAPATATSVSLSWTNNAANQTGFHLDRATDANFTQNLITESLSGTITSFTDIATGLAPGSTYYYRVRAYNSAGDSANSNVASVAIPLAPAKPSNAVVVNASTTELDLTWSDNAGITATGYTILRAVNHGAFVNYASLPPLHTTPPSTYSWSDTGLTPGTFYEYHIEAVNTSGNNDFAGTNASTLTLAPTNLTATKGTSSVRLQWTTAAGAVSYNIYRGTSSGNEATTPLATNVTGSSYIDSTITSGVNYYYKVKAVNSNTNNAPVIPSESAASNEALAVPPVQEVFFVKPSYQVQGQKLDANGIPVGSPFVVAPGSLRTISVARDAKGNLVLFGIDPYLNHVWELQFDASGNPTTTAYAPVWAGGAVESIAVGHDGSGNLELFAVDPFIHHVWGMKFDSTNKPTTVFKLLSQGEVATKLTVGHDGNGNPLLFTIDAYFSQVQEMKFNAAGDPTTDFFRPGSSFAVKQIALGYDGHGNPELFAVDPYFGHVFYLTFDATANTTSSFFLQASSVGVAQSLVVGSLANNNPEVFIVTPTYPISALKFDTNGKPVGDFAATGPSVVSVTSITVGTTTGGAPELFGLGLGDNQLYTETFDFNGNRVKTWSLMLFGAVNAIAASN
jgi:fibronectin type 3 domain-containing protein